MIIFLNFCNFTTSLYYVSRPHVRKNHHSLSTMGRSGFVYLSYTALVLLSASQGVHGGLWTVDIDESPAPSPQDGPPFSAHASRNLALLPYQIIGIVGAYVASVFIVGSLLLTVGRRSRKRAQEMATQPKEMVKPMAKAFDRSPISPGDGKNNWYLPRKLRDKMSAANSIRSGRNTERSPGMDSIASFDTTVVEADRAKRQEEMEMLYAAVMAQDERKSASASVQDLSRVPYGEPPEYSRRTPPRLITNAPALRHLQVESANQGLPQSPVRAIYPPHLPPPPGPISPTSPVHAAYPPHSTGSYSDTRANHGRMSSIGGSRNGVAPITPSSKKPRKSLRHIQISGPMIRDDHSDGARTPLSPRFYPNPGVPPEPPIAATARRIYAPTTPVTGKTWNGRYPSEQQEAAETTYPIRNLPHPVPHRLSAHLYTNDPQHLTDTASTRPDPTKPSLNTLPLRDFNRQHAARLAAQEASHFPLSPGHQSPANFSLVPASAGPVKTTFLETRGDKFSGPRTGLATPYTPYMPCTPLTPVAMHLSSTKERRARAKVERKLRGVITEEDAVRDEGELWSSGY